MNRNRDERDQERTPQDRNDQSGYHSRLNQTGGAYETRGAQDNRGGRSDYDIQSDYSGGGYDQLSPGQDLNAQRSFQGNAREQSGYLERGYGRDEDRHAQGHDTGTDDYRQRGYQGSSMQSNQRGMYGERNRQAGYSESQGREHGGYSSQGTQPYQRGPERGQYQGSQRQDSDYTQYNPGSGSTTAQGRYYGSQEYRSQGSQGDYDARSIGQRTQTLHEYGTKGSEASRATTGWGPAAMGYRGRGPQNYTRSDERIREDLNERLTDADDLDASGITVEVSNGVATLSGSVDERWMKHRAEDLTDSCSGVRDVRNQIQVKSSTQRDTSTTTGTSAYTGISGTSTAGTTSGDGSSQSTRPAGTTGTSQTKYT